MKKVLFYCIVLIFSTSIMAQTHIWTGGGGDSNWSNPDNWDVFTIPDLASDILISGNGVNVNEQGTNDGATIDVQEGATLIIEGQLSIIVTTTVINAEINIQSSGTLQNNGSSVVIQQGATLAVAGIITTNGDKTIDTGELQILAGGSLQNVGGTITIQPGATLLVEGAISNVIGGSITIDNGGVLNLNQIV